MPEPADGQPNLSISPLEIARLPTLNFKGRVVIINSPDDEARIQSLFDGEVILGFDSESRPNNALQPRNRSAVAQVASEHAACLWRLSALRGVPPLLKRLLEEPTVIKVAQGAANEVTALREEWGIGAQSFVDLHHIALNLRTTPRSLQGLVALFLHKKLAKEQRLTDWEQSPLTQAQIEYAATDAWASRQVLIAMRRAYNTDRLACERLLGSIVGTKKVPSEAEAEVSHTTNSASPDTAGQAVSSGVPLTARPASSPPLAEAQQELVALCIARGHRLRFEGTESAPQGIRCVFRVDFRHGGQSVSEIFRSARVHSSIRAAQNDAASEALARLQSMSGQA